MSHQAPDFVTVSVDAPGVADIEPNPWVGRRYEIAINGIGLMMADTPEAPDTQANTVVPSLDPPRLATSDTPFAQAIERYTFEVFHDWEAGRGQRWANREEATSRAFWDSELVDPFTTKGELKLLNTMSQSLVETFDGLRLVAVGDDLYALTDTDELTRFDGGTQTWGTAFGLSTVGDVLDITSDGQYWYVCDGTQVVRGNVTDPGAAWSEVNAHRLSWGGGRICVAQAVGGSPTPNQFTTLGIDGKEEQAGGHLTLDSGHTVVPGGAAQGVYYFGSYVGDKGLIWAWQLGVDNEGSFFVPFVAWEMPQGVVPVAVTGAAGEVWVRGHRPEGPNSGQVLIYRGVPGQGLTPVLVADLKQTEPRGTFGEVADTVLFSWESWAGDESALGAIYLPTGGHARWLSPHVQGVISDIVEWRGLEVIAVQGSGVWMRNSAEWEDEGWLITSSVDGASTLDKVLDTIVAEAHTLQTGQEVDVEYSRDGGQSFLPGITLSSPGASRAVFNVSEKAVAWALRFILRSDGSNQTILRSAQGKYHPLGIKDRIFQVRVKCYDQMTGVNKAPLPENAPGYGAKLMRLLEDLGQQRVLFQDVDWHLTNTSYVVEVVHAESNRTHLYDPKQAHVVVGGVVDLTLRKVCGAS